MSVIIPTVACKFQYSLSWKAFDQLWRKWLLKDASKSPTPNLISIRWRGLSGSIVFLERYTLITPPPIGGFVGVLWWACLCVCVCLSTIISSELHVRSWPIFCAVTYGSVLLWQRYVRYVFPVLWITSYLQRFIDHIKANLIKCNIKQATGIWRTVCDSGLRSFVNGWITTSEERRAARHTASTKPKTGPRCPKCSRVCASDFGLRSHMRSHDKTGNT